MDNKSNGIARLYHILIQKTRRSVSFLQRKPEMKKIMEHWKRRYIYHQKRRNALRQWNTFRMFSSSLSIRVFWSELSKMYYSSVNTFLRPPNTPNRTEKPLLTTNRKAGYLASARPPFEAYHSLRMWTNRVTPTPLAYKVRPKSVHEDTISPRHAYRDGIYLPVAPTSAMFLTF